MMITPQALDSLRDLLKSWGQNVNGDLSAMRLTGGRSNVTYELSDGTSKWILRRPPAVGITASAHDIGREFRIAAALADTELPVPRSIGWCEDPSLLGALSMTLEN